MIYPKYITERFYLYAVTACPHGSECSLQERVGKPIKTIEAEPPTPAARTCGYRAQPTRLVPLGMLLLNLSPAHDDGLVRGLVHVLAAGRSVTPHLGLFLH